MIANVSAHRRANAFAQALEEQTLQGDAAQQQTERDQNPSRPEVAERGRMLALTTGLGELPSPTLDPEVKVVQRAQLVAAMEAMLLEGTAPGGERADPSLPGQRTKGAHRASPLRKLRPRTRLSKSIAAGGLTVGVAAGAFGGVAAASSDALPGDSLYGLKRGMEDLKLNLAGDDADRGEIFLNQASTRLHEARRLMERDRAGSLDHESLSEVRRALSGVKYDATEGHELLHAAYKKDGSIGPIQALSSFSQSHRESWSALRDRLPPQLLDVGDQVSSVFDAIDDEVKPLRSLLPEPPQKHRGTPERPGATGQDSTGTSTDPERPTPSTPGSGSGSSSDGRSGDHEKPSPSTSHKHKDDGLLGGSTGGLLDPPDEEQSTPGDSPGSKQNGSGGSGDSGKGGPLPKPDITLPPLLPGVLPGLGINGEDAN
ncbi:DUF5667 domain-containing protein [Streptomyces tsukubensis]|uniref:DUF5667 domain-containing protein n=1 Tax=Streptomyces tsukubensis TaxID=83656 RepID=A0A1V4A7H3_9ACTN|nr:DUF5667 domain-containing protein [Streptomyces tsukubensis]OON78341.1 hypothetical protein B1H18_16205 [Streptomyces tsukubensis]QFR95102.1 hypothetical protein GBW32_21365 [Streptomyces tsukubensis]